MELLDQKKTTQPYEQDPKDDLLDHRRAQVATIGPKLRRRRRWVRAGLAKLSSFGRARPGTSFEEPPQARLVKIAHGRPAAWLDPFGMLPSQVVVDLSLKLGHGVGRVTD
jgi:hypothetical protein